MAEKSVMIDLEDPQAGKIAEVIGNKTSKKILALIAEQEKSETEIANELRLPMNTVGYNIKKLEDAGLIEKSKEIKWSEKGKRIYRYRASNKRIVIMPRKVMRGIIPGILASIVGALGIKIWSDNAIQGRTEFVQTASERAGDMATIAGSSGTASQIMAENAEKATEIIDAGGAVINSSSGFAGTPIWMWFLLGAWIALLVVVLWTIYKENKLDSSKD